jgi:hypothetical protein
MALALERARERCPRGQPCVVRHREGRRQRFERLLCHDSQFAARMADRAVLFLPLDHAAAPPVNRLVAKAGPDGVSSASTTRARFRHRTRTGRTARTFERSGVRHIGLRILASIAIDPLSHCASRTPLIGIAQSLVSLSGDPQSRAATASDHRMTPMWQEVNFRLEDRFCQ